MGVWETIMRRKRMDDVTSLETRLDRCASTLDLTFFGLGNMLGSSVYVVTGNLVRLKAGPAACVSYLIAGFAALLSALCYAELGSRFPRAGSAYTYTYVAVGEIFAFIIGWSVVCEYVIGTSTVAKGWSDTLDSLFDYAISNWTNTHLPFSLSAASPSPSPSPSPVTLPARYAPIHFDAHCSTASKSSWYGNDTTNLTTSTVWPVTTTMQSNSTDPNQHGFFDKSPDLASFGITVLFIALLCGGAKSSLRFNNVTNTISLISLVIVCGVMFVLGDVNNLSHPDGFAPFGMGGVIRGSAVAFYAYIGFDAVAVAAEEVRDPSKTVPRASAYCVVIVSVIMLLSTLALVLFIPYTETSSTAAFTDALHMRNIEWAELVCGIGGLIGMTAAMLCSVFALPRVVYAMANDGLLFTWLANVAECSRVPVISTIVFGALAAVCALVFDFDTLADFLSIGTLLAYTIVSANVIALRYVPNPDGKMVDGAETAAYAGTSLNQPADDDASDVFVNQTAGSRRDAAETARLLSNAARARETTQRPPPLYGSLDPPQVAVLTSSNSSNSLRLTSESSVELLSDNEIRQRVGFLKAGWANSCLIPECMRRAPRGRVPIIALLVYVISTVACCVIAVVSTNVGPLSSTFPFVPIYFAVPVAVSACVMVLCIVVMSAYERCDLLIHTFRVPLVPFIPCLSIAVNVLLIANLNPLTWVRFGVWLALGLVIYFGYGIRHSTEAQYMARAKLSQSYNSAYESDSALPTSTSSSIGPGPNSVNRSDPIV